MEDPRNTLPSGYPSQQLQLDESSGLSRLKEPLSDSAGNAQLHELASGHIYHDNKRHPMRGQERSMYSMPTLPSQPLRPPVGNTLELRKRHNRQQRFNRHSNRNPIVDSPQYQAYRARANRDGNNSSDSKWPEVLENAFLDALLAIPYMGRRKFSFKGKPHGRNELIREYIWIAYKNTLAPGQRPDPTMMRNRKQVSSHIQVLKGFLNPHPALFQRLFPPNKGPKNGFEDSFKKDPTLIALSQGRLPSRRHDHYDGLNQIILSNHHPMKPAAFWLLMTPFAVPNERNGIMKSEQDLRRDGLVLHRYSGLSLSEPRGSLESILHWRQKFPHLAQLHSTNDLNCDIIHMNVSLNLMKTHAPDNSELLTRLEMSIPGQDYAGFKWQSVTSLIKPAELYGDPTRDPVLEGTPLPMTVLGMTESETRIKVAIPAETWAYTFTQLMNLHFEIEKKRLSQSFGGDGLGRPINSVREYVDRISMYQELQSSAGDRMPFIRRAILIWTFHKARSGEGNETTWRYVDPAPPRHMCMSPPPHLHNHNLPNLEQYSSWPESPLHLQQPNLLDSFVQGLATPPQTASLQSPFDTTGYTYPAQHFDMSNENISFVSHATVDSESTLVNGNDPTNQIDNFLTNSGGVNMGAYGDVNGHYYGHLPSNTVNANESFDADPAWANYSVPASTPWEHSEETKGLAWPDTSTQIEPIHKHSWSNGAQEQKQAQATWNGEDMDINGVHVNGRDNVTGKHGNEPPWSDAVMGSSPSKQNGNGYIENNIEAKLLPWIEQATAEEEAQAQARRNAVDYGSNVDVMGVGVDVDVDAGVGVGVQLERNVAEDVNEHNNITKDGHFEHHDRDTHKQNHHRPHQHDALEQTEWPRNDEINGVGVGVGVDIAHSNGYDFDHLDESISVKS
ncbi:4b30084b-64f8-4c6b-bf99-dc1b2099316e [Sclerotinia trifoliorum]|uniref:4b30084b-64f8-4c6b-bf99-dc1b2099316e n=1 Tax=Sclerotinia trifoliorum TaxID=28548 RepID=A0A8H2VNK1_9HELO|nr:4b30084b-64f8-4c6b-bf99-dc1b2099316e [Sclerotinia trifoliorum]